MRTGVISEMGELNSCAPGSGSSLVARQRQCVGHCPGSKTSGKKHLDRDCNCRGQSAGGRCRAAMKELPPTGGVSIQLVRTVTNRLRCSLTRAATSSAAKFV